MSRLSRASLKSIVDGKPDRTARSWAQAELDRPVPGRPQGSKAVGVDEVIEAVERHGGREKRGAIAAAAAELGVSRDTIERRLRGE